MTAIPKPHAWIAGMLLGTGALLASSAAQAQLTDATIPANLDPCNRNTVGFPQRGHGSIRLTTLFNDPNDPE